MPRQEISEWITKRPGVLLQLRTFLKNLSLSTFSGGGGRVFLASFQHNVGVDSESFVYVHG